MTEEKKILDRINQAIEDHWRHAKQDPERVALSRQAFDKLLAENPPSVVISLGWEGGTGGGASVRGIPIKILEDEPGDFVAAFSSV